jgi:LacI family transcriptional regulator
MASGRTTDRTTIRTVAADAGVSVAAVSKVLRNAYGVSDELRARVEASIARLGYRPRAAARAMRGQTDTIGVLLADIRNPFFSNIMDGVHTALERTKYQSLVGISQSALSIELALIDAMTDRPMDGLILVAPRMAAADVTITALRTPTVLIGHHEPEATLFDTVNDDDRLGAELVVGHLVATGRSDIAFLSLEIDDPINALVTSQREIGYRAAMSEHGLSAHIDIVRAGQSSRETQAAARRLLKGRKRPQAVFCWTDFVALEVLSVARELGLSVPHDIAVVGYDNTSYCDLAQNDLTSIDQSGHVLGLQAARLLIERIKGRTSPEHFVVTPRLAARGSSWSRI